MVDLEKERKAFEEQWRLLGVYTHCLNCGGDGTYGGTSIEAKGG
ncbi:hypothetical protein F943_02129 [Acinetobacter ursingii NIPH 706]|nr:hypothetical protein [Acinetobacter ursingii]ENX48597.1 hypothetical protein F943_02129 [Acinetobacter ursingii NIPH 706]